VVEEEITGVEDEKGKRMAQILSFLVLCLEEDLEDAIVEGREDKLQVKPNRAQGSLDWIVFLVEETATAVTVVEVQTAVTTMDTIMDTTMAKAAPVVIIMDITMDTIMAKEAPVDTTMAKAALGVSATIT